MLTFFSYIYIDALQNAHIHENTKKISIIDTLSLEVTESQLLNVIPLSGILMYMYNIIL